HRLPSFTMLLPPPRYTLFPYTTLFRSQLRRLGFRFIALADDNFYPVSLTDLRLAAEQHDLDRLNRLKAIRAERFALMALLAQLPDRKSTRLNSSHVSISYAVFCLKKKT